MELMHSACQSLVAMKTSFVSARNRLFIMDIGQVGSLKRGFVGESALYLSG